MVLLETNALERDTWGDETDLAVEKGEESISTEASNLQLTGASFVFCPLLVGFLFFGSRSSM